MRLTPLAGAATHGGEPTTFYVSVVGYSFSQLSPRLLAAFSQIVSGAHMSDGESLPLEDVTISVERMMRFCQLAEMLFKCADKPTTVLPLHLTRFGTLLIETASFLYSLFDDRPDSTNLVRLWKEFDHPFTKDLQAHATRLAPFKEDLKLVRNRLGFHGSLTRSHEQGGLAMFDVESGRAKTFARLTRDMQILFLRMILWYMKKLDSETHPSETMWREFTSDMKEPFRG